MSKYCNYISLRKTDFNSNKNDFLKKKQKKTYKSWFIEFDMILNFIRKLGFCKLLLLFPTQNNENFVAYNICKMNDPP